MDRATVNGRWERGSHNRGQGRARRRPFAWSRTLGALLILGIAMFAALSRPTQGASVLAAPAGSFAASGSMAVSAPAATPSARKGSGLPGDGDPRIYWDTIKRRVARGLHRSVASLSRLWSVHPASPPVKKSGGPPPTTIYDIAVQEGLSVQQLRTLELAAIQQACAALVRRHTLTRPQASQRIALIRGWDQSSLDGYVMYAFGKP